MIAALYVERGGCYYGLDGVDPWEVERDARTYAGPHPVIAHPPCERRAGRLASKTIANREIRAAGWQVMRFRYPGLCRRARARQWPENHFTV